MSIIPVFQLLGPSKLMRAPERVHDKTVPFPRRICDEAASITLRYKDTAVTASAEFGEMTLRARHAQGKIRGTAALSTLCTEPLLKMYVGERPAWLKFTLPGQDCIKPALTGYLETSRDIGSAGLMFSYKPKLGLRGRLGMTGFHDLGQVFLSCDASQDRKEIYAVLGIARDGGWVAGEVGTDGVVVSTGIGTSGMCIGKTHEIVGAAWTAQTWKRFTIAPMLLWGNVKYFSVRGVHKGKFGKTAVELTHMFMDKGFLSGRCRFRFKVRGVDCEVHGATGPWWVLEFRQRFRTKMVTWELSEWFDRSGVSLRPQIVIDVAA